MKLSQFDQDIATLKKMNVQTASGYHVSGSDKADLASALARINKLGDILSGADVPTAKLVVAGNLYMDVLNGSRVMVDKWHGLWLSPDGEFIIVQGSGSWAFKSDEKGRFYEELEGLVNNHAHGDDSKIEVRLWDF